MLAWKVDAQAPESTKVYSKALEMPEPPEGHKSMLATFPDGDFREGRGHSEGVAAEAEGAHQA
eukprot:11065574-Alexandrium_andersonii.AAC.1